MKAPALRKSLPAVVAGSGLLLALSSVGAGLATNRSLAESFAGYDVHAGIVGLAFVIVSALILRDDPGNRIGPMLAGASLWTLLGVLANIVAADLSSTALLTRLLIWANSMWLVLPCAVLLLPLTYPHGRAMSARWVWPVRIAMWSAIAGLLFMAVSTEITPKGTKNPFAPPLPDFVTVVPMAVAMLTLLALSIAGMIGQLRLMHSVSPDRRRRTAWLVAAVALFILSNAAPSRASALFLDVLAIGAIGVGIVRERLFDIESVLSRAAVFMLIVGTVVASELVLAGFVEQSTRIDSVPIIAAVALGFALASVHRRMVGVANRLLFGQRDDPSKALQEMGARLSAAVDTDTTFGTIVATVSKALRLPYAALVLEGELVPVAEIGTPSLETVLDIPMSYAGHQIAQLRVAARRGERGLDSVDVRALTSFVLQASSAVHAALVTRDLRRSRERIVSANEEERRALRRDLHDGVGPGLAGLALGLEIAVRRADHGTADPDLLRQLHEQASASLENIREIARDLRPSVLDELGLIEALRQQSETVTQFTGGRPGVRLLAPQSLVQLPAAVEVAAYRITAEAMSNAVRHSGARECQIAITVGDSLVIDITDDGNGRAPVTAGVGLESMRERADELGGKCTVTFRSGVGTSVHASLPLIALGRGSDA